MTAQDKDILKKAFEKINDENVTVKELFGNEIGKEIYKNGTYGKYGQINSFVKNEDISDIDKDVVKFLNYIKEKAVETLKKSDIKESSEALTNDINIKNILENDNLIKNIVKKINRSNTKYLAGGLGLSILGLSVIVPKLTFWVTKKITGKDEFVAIADFSEKEKSNKS